MKRPSKKTRWKPYVRMRFRKHDPAHNLQAAVQHYVHANGGALTIIGEIELQDFHEGPHHFRIAVRCLGRRPDPKPKGGER